LKCEKALNFLFIFSFFIQQLIVTIFLHTKVSYVILKIYIQMNKFRGNDSWLQWWYLNESSIWVETQPYNFPTRGNLWLIDKRDFDKNWNK
jgi:hypothetical protein